MVLLTGLIALMTGCLPAAQDDGIPDVAVINAPTEYRVEGLALGLERVVAERYAPLPFDFIEGRRVRFQETHREMHGERAPLQAAFILRALGGELAVLVGAPLYEREVSESDGERRVETTVQLRASIVEPQDAGVLDSFTSRTYHAVRLEPADEPLVPPEEDPDLKESSERALGDLAGPLVARLSLLLSQ